MPGSREAGAWHRFSLGAWLPRSGCLAPLLWDVRLHPYRSSVAKPLEEWTLEELRAEAIQLIEQLARRAAAPPAAGGRKGPDVVRACENWVRGLAWDETFTEEMVDDELSIHERKTGQELGPLERERLVQLWRTNYGERYRDAA